MTSRATDEPVATTLAQGLAAHQAGQLDEAEAHYRAALASDPRHVDALHMLALVHAQRGDLATAERLIAQASAAAPHDAAIHFNHGNILLQGGRYAAALASYERAAALDPAHAGSHTNRGLALDALGRRGEAVASYDRAIALSPGNALAHTNRGNALAALGRLPEALASHDAAVALAPGDPQAWYNRGNALLATQPEAALASYDRAIALDPQAAETWCNRGLALDALGRFDDALASFDRAIALRPHNAEAALGRGNVLGKLERWNAALASYDQALACDPASAKAWCNRAIACVTLGRFAEAIDGFERALTLEPDDASTHRHLAIVRLTIGDFARGWTEYEWRWQTPAFRRRPFTQPMWTGDADIAGKTILLHAEQGLGDAIQFCRYATQVARRGAHVVVESPPPLARLMRTLPGIASVVEAGSPLPAFDLHCPLMSLPHAFHTTLATVPAEVPYLSAAPARIAAWRERLASLRRPRIGLAWAGNPRYPNDARRSIALASLLPLIGDAPASIVTLQKDLRPGDAELLARAPGIVRLDQDLTTLDETAAAMAALDLVIAVDTAVAHLAGALARPVWVLLPFVPDWRWMLDRGDSPWYPTARLFRQTTRDDWTEVIARVGAAIGQLTVR